MQYKVKFGTVRVPNENGSITRYFRGDLVELDPEDPFTIEHLANGAFVAAEDELPVLGTVFDTETGEAFIDANSSDEEVLAWLMSANAVETLVFLGRQQEENPEFAARVGDLLTQVIDQRTGEQIVVPPEKITLDDEPSEDDEDGDDDADAGNDLDDLDPEEFAEPAFVVTHSLNKISEYLKNHPDQAQAVLDAEYFAAAAAGIEPRKGIERLIQSLAGATD